MRRDLQQQGREIQPEPTDPLEAAELAVARAVAAARPYERVVEATQTELIDARSELYRRQNRAWVLDSCAIDVTAI